MKITIINSERTEKTYAREELEEFVAQLSNGTFRQKYIRDIKKEVCFAAEWVKTNGNLRVKTINPLVLLSLENLRDSRMRRFHDCLDAAIEKHSDKQDGYQGIEGWCRFLGQGPQPLYRLEPHPPLLSDGRLHQARQGSTVRQCHGRTTPLSSYL